MRGDKPRSAVVWPILSTHRGRPTEPSVRDQSFVGRLSAAEKDELKRAFEILGGTDGPTAERIGPAQALAAISHFDPAATIDTARHLCEKHSGDTSSGLLDLCAFVEMMHDVAQSTGPAHALFSELDPEGLGVVSQQDAMARLAPEGSLAAEQLREDDLLCMLELLRGEAHVIERQRAIQALRMVLKC